MSPQPLFDMLGDATRRRILVLLLVHGELCVCEIMVALDEAQPKTSRHLAAMKEAGLVSARREGTWMHYRLEHLPAWAEAILQALAQGAVPEHKADMERLEKMANRPARCAA